MTYTSSGQNANPLGWMTMPEADIILATAKERIWASNSDPQVRFEILDRVIREIVLHPQDGLKNILVLERLGHSAGNSILKEVLLKGIKRAFSSSLKKYQRWRDRLPTMAWEYNPVTKQPKLVDLENLDEDSENESKETAFHQNEDAILNQLNSFESSDLQIHCFSFENVSRFSFGLLLDFIRPTHIILCDIDLPFLRTIELYQWGRLASILSMTRETDQEMDPPSLSVSVFQQEGSAQEHRYLIQLRAEVDAFTALSKMNVKFPLIAATNVHEILSRIYVDTREFRSILPSLLHSSDRFEVFPMMLSIGDYIIERKLNLFDHFGELGKSSFLQMFIERKSLSDLVGSFTNGRLYDFCVPSSS